MDIIIPCASTDTNFPNMRPNYLLADYLSRRMLELVVEPYLSKYRIHVVITQQAQDSYNVVKEFDTIFGDQVNVVILSKSTSGSAESAYQALIKLNLESTAFMIRECTGMFAHDTVLSGNIIHVGSLNHSINLTNITNKDYVKANGQGFISCIAEKEVIGDLFCAGGYQFESARKYKLAYTNLLKSNVDKISIKSIVDYYSVSWGEDFSVNKVSDFVDLSTIQDWEAFNDRPTIFCDIDGTIIHNQTPYGDNNYGATPTVLEKNVQTLRHFLIRGSQIIFTTSRTTKWYAETRQMLDSLGFHNCQLIMDLHHARRILINDHALTNPYPSAVAINIRRNDDSLDQMIGKRN